MAYTLCSGLSQVVHASFIFWVVSAKKKQKNWKLIGLPLILLLAIVPFIFTGIAHMQLTLHYSLESIPFIWLSEKGKGYAECWSVECSFLSAFLLIFLILLKYVCLESHGLFGIRASFIWQFLLRPTTWKAQSNHCSHFYH